MSDSAVLGDCFLIDWGILQFWRGKQGRSRRGVWAFLFSGHCDRGFVMKKRREEDILKQLETREFISTEEAMELVGGSAATVRRVFIRLAESNLAKRVYGGIRSIPKSTGDAIPHNIREGWLREEKQRLAKRAVEFAPLGSAVFLHGGSTTIALAHHIRGCTIITDCIGICNVLMNRFSSGGGPDVILTGGMLDLKTDMLTGFRAEEGIRDYRADVVFFSARGMDDEGVLDLSDPRFATIRLMIQNADMRVMIADHSKFRKFGLMRMAAWKDINVLVTSDHPENRPWFKKIEKHGVKIVFA